MPLDPEEVVRTAHRTLRAAGYVITDSTRTDQYVALVCERTSLLRAKLRFVVAISYSDDFTDGARARLSLRANEEHAVLIYVAASDPSKEDVVPWREFLDVLGGAIPSWRALSSDYRTRLVMTSIGELPANETAEAWRLFEDLVADGLEFVLGRRVRRLGARRRGEDVPDMLASTPDDLIFVVDAKSTKSAGAFFDGRDLRALREYCQRQTKIQRGVDSVGGAIVVAPAFRQDADGLLLASRDFYAETGLAVSYVTATTLADAVDVVRGAVQLRVAVPWKRVFAGGLVTVDSIQTEFEAVRTRRYQDGRL
jgi:hypothetical protein